MQQLHACWLDVDLIHKVLAYSSENVPFELEPIL
jgi:hypothetical protein